MSNDNSDDVTQPGASANDTTVPSASAGAPTRIRYFGDYELIEEVARGGMGVVWRARQVSLNRTVAVKMILSGQFASDAEVKRFRVEAEAAANLQHPNIVAIHEVGEHEGRHYFSMDFIEGKNLAEYVASLPEPLSAQSIARLMKAIAEAVHYAHQRGTLHRDLKPQNILMDAQGQPHITDFGLAKRFEVSAPGAPSPSADAGELTQTGAVIGSPSYMAPEQAAARADAIGPATDVYSLGAILYQLLTGKPPHRGTTTHETIQQVLTEDPVAPRKLRANLPRDLETVCLKCLEKLPERRYPTARFLAEEFQRFQDNEPVLAKPAGPLRRSWSWVLRRPWMIALAASALLVTSMSGAYNLWHRFQFERRQSLFLQVQQLCQSMPEDATKRAVPYARGMQLLREAAATKPDSDVLVFALDLMAHGGTPLLRINHGHGKGQEAVASARLSADGRYLAAAFSDGIVEVFSTDHGKSVYRSARLDLGSPRVACSFDGAWIAVADSARSGGEVRLWRWASEAPPLAFRAHEGRTTALAFSPDGQQLITGGAGPEAGARNMEIRTWEVQPPRPVQTIECFAGAHASMAYFHARQRFRDIKNEIVEIECSADGRLLMAKTDAGAHELMRKVEPPTPGAGAGAVRWQSNAAASRDWMGLLGGREVLTARQTWENWSNEFLDATSGGASEWRYEWWRRARRNSEHITPDGRFCTVGFLEVDLRAGTRDMVPMPGQLIALGADGTWLSQDPKVPSFALWRPADVQTEWAQLQLGRGVLPGNADGGSSRVPRVIFEAFGMLGSVVLCAVVAALAQIFDLKIGLRRHEGAVPSRALLVSAAVVGVITIVFAIGVLARLIPIAAWGELDVVWSLFLVTVGACIGSFCWGLATTVRVFESFRDSFVGHGAVPYRKSHLEWFGALAGLGFFSFATFPESIARMEAAQAQLTNFTQLRSEQESALLGSMVGILVGVATMAKLSESIRQSRKRVWLGRAKFIGGFALGLSPVVAWSLATARGSILPVAIWQYSLGVALGAILASGIFPRVKAIHEQNAVDRHVLKRERVRARRR